MAITSTKMIGTMADITGTRGLASAIIIQTNKKKKNTSKLETQVDNIKIQEFNSPLLSISFVSGLSEKKKKNKQYINK